jgi:hypothetical protein
MRRVPAANIRQHSRRDRARVGSRDVVRRSVCRWRGHRVRRAHPQQRTLCSRGLEFRLFWFTEAAGNKIGKLSDREWQQDGTQVLQVSVDRSGGVWEIPSSRVLNDPEDFTQITGVVQIAPGTGNPVWILNGRQQFYRQFYANNLTFQELFPGIAWDTNTGAIY